MINLFQFKRFKKSNNLMASAGFKYAMLFRFWDLFFVKVE